MHIILAFYTRAVLVQPKGRLDRVRQLALVKQVGLPRHARPGPVPSLAYKKKLLSCKHVTGIATTAELKCVSMARADTYQRGDMVTCQWPA